MGNRILSAARLLARIRALDAAHWSQPSNSLALEVHNAESRFRELTGFDCPEWPRRESRELSNAIRKGGCGLTGRTAYEADCMAIPTYHTGETRETWDRLCNVQRWSWERLPT